MLETINILLTMFNMCNVHLLAVNKVQIQIIIEETESGSEISSPSEVAEWLAHWLLVLEVPGSIPAGGEENLLVRTRFPSCHLQE